MSRVTLSSHCGVAVATSASFLIAGSFWSRTDKEGRKTGHCETFLIRTPGCSKKYVPRMWQEADSERPLAVAHLFCNRWRRISRWQASDEQCILNGSKEVIFKQTAAKCSSLILFSHPLSIVIEKWISLIGRRKNAISLFPVLPLKHIHKSHRHIKEARRAPPRFSTLVSATRCDNRGSFPDAYSLNVYVISFQDT